jgi:hypothetical protein
MEANPLQKWRVLQFRRAAMAKLHAFSAGITRSRHQPFNKSGGLRDATPGRKIAALQKINGR